jgi:putative oxidoreductase
VLMLPAHLKARRAGLATTMGPEAAARLRVIGHLVDRYSISMLRMSFGVVFIWFGALKVADATPVAKLVAATVPFVPAHVLVRSLGLFEAAIGLAMLVGRLIGVVVCLMVTHLAGTFLVLVTQPTMAFQHGNPLQLTMTGEFVVKNIVLISAGLVLATASRVRTDASLAESPAT